MSFLSLQRTPDLSVATQYTTYSYRNEILAKENANEVAESNDVQVQISATESVKVIRNLVTVPFFEGSSDDSIEVTRTTEPTTILNTYMRPLQNSLTLRQIVKTVINNQPEADLEEEIDTAPVETEIPMTTTPTIIENFKKLAPVVLNAMADLLQKLPGNVKQKAIEKSDENIAEESTFKKPIYIPVIDSVDLQASASTNGAIPFLPEKKSSGSLIAAQQDSETGESEIKFQILDHNHFLPPNIGAPNLELNEHEVQVPSSHKNELHLMDLKLHGNSPSNGGVGIPISPGEIINTNSDVIIGRPSGGTKPRLPNSVNSIPLQAHIHHHNQHVHTHQQQQYHNNQNVHLSAQPSSIKEEVYHGPPPPPPPKQVQPLVHVHERKTIPLKIHSTPPQDQLYNPDLSLNVPPHRPPTPQSSFHSDRAPPQASGKYNFHNDFSDSVGQNGPLSYKHSDGPPPIHFYQKPSDHLLKPQFQSRPQPPPKYHHSQPPTHHQLAHTHHHHHVQQNQRTPQLNNAAASISVADTGYIGNDILEIRPIPEVYSTDLPPVLVQSHDNFHDQGHAQINLQPSQVTNVVIPSRNDFGLASVSSGSATNTNGNGASKGQKFTYGKYFSEPSPYQGQDKLEFYTNKPQLVVVDSNNGKAAELRPKNEPNPSFIQFQPNAANEISVHASPIQFQQTIQVETNNQFDDLESDQGHRDEPILVSTSNRISSVSSLDGKTQIKVSEQQDERDTQDIVVQNQFNFNANIRDSATTTTTSERPFRNSELIGNFRQHLGPFGFNHNIQNQSPAFATNQVLINNQASIDVQLSSLIGTSQGAGSPNPSQVGSNNIVQRPPASVLRNAPQRPHKGERFPQHYHKQQRPPVQIPALPHYLELPSEVQKHVFNKRLQTSPPPSPPTMDDFDRMTSKGPTVEIPHFNHNSRNPQHEMIRPVPSTNHYDHDSYGQNPPPPPTVAPVSSSPPQQPPPRFKLQPSQFWDGPPAKGNGKPGTPYPFDKGAVPPTPPSLNRINPASPIQGPSTLQSHNKQQQEIQSGVNEIVNEIAGNHLSIATPPPPHSVNIFKEKTTTAPFVARPRPEVLGPINGLNGHINFRVQTSPQTINNEFHQLIQDGQVYADNYASASSTGAPQQADVSVFTSTSTTPAVTVDSQTEYNGLKEMSKYHHIERKQPAHPPPMHHHTSMKISRVPQRPLLPQRNTTFASHQVHEEGNNGDVPSTNLKSNSRGTSKFYYNLSHKPYQPIQHQRPTLAPITVTTLASPATSPEVSTISSVRVRLPHKGVPFNKGPVTISSKPVEDNMAMDLTPPPVRPIELSFGQGFQKPSRFDGDTTTAPQRVQSAYQTIKRPNRPSIETNQETNVTIMTERPHSYWDSHHKVPSRTQHVEVPVRNRGPPPTMSPTMDNFVTSSAAPLPRRTSIHDRRIVSSSTQGPYEFETAEPDIITVPNGKDDSVFLKASWGPPYAFDSQRPEITFTNRPEAASPDGETVDAESTDLRETKAERPSIVLFQAPRNPTTLTPETPNPTETTTLDVTEEVFSTTTEHTTTSTTPPTTTTTLEPETTVTTELTTEAPTTTTKGYKKVVRLRPKLSLSTTTTRKPIVTIRTNSTFVKPIDRPRVPFLKPSISVVQLNTQSPSTSTTTEGPTNKTESIFVVMRPANQAPVVPHQHRPSIIITRKPDTKRPVDLHPVTRDEDDAFHTNSESRLVIAGVHHIQDNTFTKEKQFGGKVSPNGESGNIYLHPAGDTGPSADEDPSETPSAAGTAEPSPDDYVVCEPGCNAAKNEKCILFSDPGLETQDGTVVKYTKCACRPGFGRMFPDRPCKRK